MAYWVPKLQRNVTRDTEHQRRLSELGWEALTVWECDVHDTKQLAKQIKRFLGRPRQA